MDEHCLERLQYVECGKHRRRWAKCLQVNSNSTVVTLHPSLQFINDNSAVICSLCDYVFFQLDACAWISPRTFCFLCSLLCSILRYIRYVTSSNEWSKLCVQRVCVREQCVCEGVVCRCHTHYSLTHTRCTRQSHVAYIHAHVG